MEYSLWTEASVDVEARQAAERLTRAKVAVAPLWPFLAMAKTEGEFEHRLALVAERIGQTVEPDLHDPVTASLREDFRRVAADDSDGEDGEESDGDDKPDWLQEKIDKSSVWYHVGNKEWVGVDPAPVRTVASYYHAGLGRWVAVDDDATAGKGNPYYFTGGPEGGPNTGQTNQFPPSPTVDPIDPLNQMFPMQPEPWTGGVEWQEQPMNFSPPRGQTAVHGARGRRPFVASDGGHGIGEDFLDYQRLMHAPGWPQESETDQPRKDNAEEYGLHPDDVKWPYDGSHMNVHPHYDPAQHDHAIRSMNHRHSADGGHRCQDCGQPVTRTSSDGASWWNHIGPYGAMADDDHPPIPPSSEKVDRGRGPRSDSIHHRYTHASNEHNPGYFDEGSQGVQGDEQFPVDEAQGVDPVDPINERNNDWRQPLAAASAPVHHAPVHHAPDSDKLLGTDFDSPEERERWQKAQRGEHPGSRDSSAMTGARVRNVFYDPNDAQVRSVRVLALGDEQLQQQQPAGTPGQAQPSPPPPPSMTGGPGSVAQRPLTTSPRQIPGGGSDGVPPSTNPTEPGSDPLSTTSTRHHALGIEDDDESRSIPTAENPTGLGDEYREKTINGPLQSRPRQSAEHRNVNTPQRPTSPIPTRSSSDIPQGEDDDERREASRVASRAIRELVGV